MAEFKKGDLCLFQHRIQDTLLIVQIVETDYKFPGSSKNPAYKIDIMKILKDKSNNYYSRIKTSNREYIAFEDELTILTDIGKILYG